MSSDDRFEENLKKRAGVVPTASQIGNKRPMVVPSRKPVNRNQFGAFTVTPKGLQVAGDARLEDWQELGEYLFAFEGAVQWLIGDWLAFGEDVKWGDIPLIAQNLGRKPSSLNQYAYVSRKVQISTRVDNLSWHHHLMVAKLTLEEQRQALQHALENGLNREDFAVWLRGTPPPPPVTATTITDQEAKQIMQEMAKIERKPPQKRKEKHIYQYRGYVASLEQYVADKKKWLEQGRGDEE